MKKSPIASHQLYVFSLLAHHQSFTRAAQDLSCTQSAVSHSLDALEHALGARLCRYEGHRVWLTSAGEQVLRHTKKILREIAALRASLARLKTKKGIVVSLPLVRVKAPVRKLRRRKSVVDVRLSRAA